MILIPMMRIYLTLVCLVAIVVTEGYGQTYRHAIQPGFNSTGGVMQIMPDSTIRIVGLASDDWWFGHTLVATSRFSLAGKRVSELLLNDMSHEEAFGFDVMPLTDGTMLIVAALVGCDYSFPATLGLLDADDLPQWVTLVEGVGDYGVGIAIDPVAYQIIRVADQDAHQAFYMFNGMQVTGPSVYQIYDEIVTMSSGYFARLDSSVFLLDSALQTVSASAFSAQVLAMDSVLSGYFVATQDSLFLLDSTLTPLRSAGIEEGSPDQIFGTRDHFWMLDQEAGHVYRLDTLLEVTDVFPFSPIFNIIDVAGIGDTILISGTCDFRNTSMFLIQTTAQDFTMALPADIGLTDVRLVDSAAYELVDWWDTGGYPVRDVTYGPVYVTLENFGTDTIQETEVRFEEYACPGVCAGVLQYVWHMTALNLSPGEAREYFLGNLSFSCTYYDIHSLCLYTMNPNGEPDGDPANDHHCTTVDFITEVADLSWGHALKFFPNPATDRIYMDVSEGMSGDSDLEVYLLNTDGRRVHKSTCQNGLNQLDVGGLPRGVYVACIVQEGRMVACEKIVLA